jgi:radical SAM superfamily enzyme YgiQ (UPF0313 family)
MLALINTNMMTPPIAPVGLDYVASAANSLGVETEILDLCLADEKQKSIEKFFAENNPSLVGLSFRNIDDCFWPSAKTFLPDLKNLIEKIKTVTDAPIVVGGVGFSTLAERIFQYCGADFGIRGDGEYSTAALYQQITGQKIFDKVSGLIWRNGKKIIANLPSWPMQISIKTNRDAIDNVTYFRLGGQVGIETKRGCDRNCLYCADPLAKGRIVRTRTPQEIAAEASALIEKGIDVFHICDSEFNIPPAHAFAVCEEFIRTGLNKKMKWYAYLSTVPFSAILAKIMRKAGCAGINFTGDSASTKMLKTYRQIHLKSDIATAVKYCRENNIKSMIDLLLGGPGETAETVKETIDFIKSINPDCAGASLGIKIYPGTEMEKTVLAEGEPEKNPSIKRKYDGGVDFLFPTFYVSHLLGERPAELVRNLIGDDKRFFPPADEAISENKDHNYNDNTRLVEAIKNGARGAYWDILKQITK